MYSRCFGLKRYTLVNPSFILEKWRIRGYTFHVRFPDTNGACVIIRKTCPKQVYLFQLHFCVAKLGYARVYLFFAFLLLKIH